MTSLPTPDLARLLASPEGQYFERKSLWEGQERKRRRDFKEVRAQIAEYVAAFANADGGVLLLGVEDDGTPTGHSYPWDHVEQLLLVPTQDLVPPQPAGQRVRHQGVELLKFDVPCAPSAVRVANDGTPRRIADRNERGESESAINAIKQRGRVESPELDEVAGRTVEHLDLERVAVARAAAGMAGATDAEYLVARRLADWRVDRLVLRVGALLLFAREAHYIDHPNAGVRIFRVVGTERTTGSRYNTRQLGRPEGALPGVIEQAHAIIADQVRVSERLHDLFFREMPEYPEYAWQEALVNAVAHRDYRVRGRGVEVHIFDDRMEITSPGALVPEVSIVGLRQRRRVHAARNPVLTRVLAELGFMREQGEGIPRIFEEVERSWLKLPELDVDEHIFTVRLFNEPVFKTPHPDWLRHVNGLSISDRQRRVLLAYPRGAFSNADYQHLNAVDRDTAYRELRELVALGHIEAPRSQGRGARWRVVGAPSPLPAAPAGRKALVALMEAQGSFRAEDYRREMGVSRPTAAANLASLRASGVLVLEGRGRGAHYRPGPLWNIWKDARK